MTEKQIIQYLSFHLDRRKYPFQMCNAFIYGSWECDYWALSTDGLAREFEIKISRGDFFSDFKKPKHKLSGANYFYYVVPTGLIARDEVDPRYGLMYVGADGMVTIEKKPKLLHGGIFREYRMLAEKLFWRYDRLWRSHNTPFNRDCYISAMNIDLGEGENDGTAISGS